MKIICLITALSVNGLNYTCTHKGRHLVLMLFWFDLGLSACLNEGGTLPTGQHLICFYWVSDSASADHFLLLIFDKVFVTSAVKASAAFIFQTYRIICHPLTHTGAVKYRLVSFCSKQQLQHFSSPVNSSAAVQGVKSLAVVFAWN